MLAATRAQVSDGWALGQRSLVTAPAHTDGCLRRALRRASNEMTCMMAVPPADESPRSAGKKPKKPSLSQALNLKRGVHWKYDGTEQ